MYVTALNATESVTRSIARWSSVIAAIMFVVTFATDETQLWNGAPGHTFLIGLIVAIYSGYALALLKRFELLGSVIAMVSTIAFCVICLEKFVSSPNPYFLVVGVPALLHLVAIILHGYALPNMVVQCHPRTNGLPG